MTWRSAGSRRGACPPPSPARARAPRPGTGRRRRRRGGCARRGPPSARAPRRGAPPGAPAARSHPRPGPRPAAATRPAGSPPRRPARARRWRARWPPRARGTAAGPRGPVPRPPRGTRARRRAARARWVGPACSRLRQLEQLELHLGDAATEARELDAPRPVDEAPRLHHADDRPLAVPEHLPPAHRRRVDGRAAGARVGGEELLALAEAADRLRVRAEAPRAHAEPAQILHRIADVGELPVEHGAQALGTEDDVADAEVAVHQGLGAWRGRRGREPAERQLERRVRIERDRAVELPVAA